MTDDHTDDLSYVDPRANPGAYLQARKQRQQIVTEYIRPPVPTTRWDWMAHIKGDEEGPTGYGPTEAEALRDLAEQLAAL